METPAEFRRALFSPEEDEMAFVDMHQWVVMSSPGHAGFKKDERDRARDELYGPGGRSASAGAPG